MSKSKINVIKVPNEERDDPPSSTEFPRMPRMYLELLENKDKIKPGVVNKEYDPDEVETIVSSFPPKPVSVASENEEESRGGDDEDDDSENDEEEDGGEEEEDDEDEATPPPRNSPASSASPPVAFSIRSSEDEGSTVSRVSRRSVASSLSSVAPPPPVLNDQEQKKKSETREKLKEILRDPPRLSDLEKTGGLKRDKVIPTIKSLSVDEEDELKRELLYKFDLLKRSYKNVDIPDFSMHSDYRNMNKTYENTLRRVSLDTNVENYKNYLIAGFMLMEYVLGSWLRFDMAGFTQQQVLNMNQYERLLIELGEKSYVPDNKKWPVELRLLGMVVLNAVIFVVAKIIMNKTGTSLFGLMNAQQNQQKNVVKRRMKGPSIDLSTFPETEATEPV